MIRKAQALYNKLMEPIRRSQTNPYKSSSDYIKSKILSLAVGYTALKTTDADMVLGYIPLYGVQDYEIARSTDELNFRASKGQFFRQQKGEEFAAIINITLAGPTRYIMLSMVEALYETAHVNTDKEVMLKTKMSVDNNSFETEYAPTKLREMGETEFEIHDDRWINTFTLVTRNDVLFDIYIENFVYDRNVKNGQNIISLSLFCKKFVPGDVYYVTDVQSENKYEYDIDVKNDKINVIDKKGGAIINGEPFYNIRGFPEFHYLDGIKRQSAYGIGEVELNTYSHYRTLDREPVPYKPEMADWYDLSIRSAFRLISTAERYIKMRNYGTTAIGWSLMLDKVSKGNRPVIYRVIDYAGFK